MVHSELYLVEFLEISFCKELITLYPYFFPIYKKNLISGIQIHTKMF